MNAALGPMFVTLHTSQNGHAEDQLIRTFVKGCGGDWEHARRRNPNRLRIRNHTRR